MVQLLPTLPEVVQLSTLLVPRLCGRTNLVACKKVEPKAAYSNEVVPLKLWYIVGITDCHIG